MFENAFYSQIDHLDCVNVLSFLPSNNFYDSGDKFIPLTVVYG